LIELLGVDGSVRGPVPMTSEQVVDSLRLMLLSRAVDDRLIKLQRMGRVGVYGPVHGQEAAVIGSAMALDPDRDWIVPASREHPAMLRHGLPLKNMFATYMGNFDAAAVPDGVRVLPRQQSIGSQLPHAAGLAWALKLRGIRGAVAVYFGEGASSEGDFHEASNLAGVMRVPLVMMLINNHYAISTPVHKQTAALQLAARAEGYGFPGFVVDGNDLFAVYATTVEAVNRALSGGGPTLIECRTYRMGFHNTSDNPKEYRDQAELDDAQQRDPIERVRRFATREGTWSAAQETAALDEIRSEIEIAQREVEEMPRPGAAAIFEHVYETLSPRLQQQRAEALDDARPS
jgi:pyruvate dehydrogenase E1 component alpha subunit